LTAVVPRRRCGLGNCSDSGDGQTTNPSLIAKNPEVKKLIACGHTLTEEEEAAEYRKNGSGDLSSCGKRKCFN
jgi:hypothetical protein